MIHPQLFKDAISQFEHVDKNAYARIKILDEDKYSQLFTRLTTNNQNMCVDGSGIDKQIKKTSQSVIWRLT